MSNTRAAHFKRARRDARDTVAAPDVQASQRVIDSPQTKLVLVDFHSGQAVRHHPDIQQYLNAGWRIKSAVPRVVEAEGTRLLVVLMRRPSREIPVSRQRQNEA
jgi:hypothetical protein